MAMRESDLTCLATACDQHPDPNRSGMHPAYFETHFQQVEAATDWPCEFAIITAFATTGACWSEEENAQADRALETELRAAYPWVRRLTGFSPSTGHAEPGWAVAIELPAARQLGARYLQDAIYFVSKDTLVVASCKTQAAPVAVGAFRCRVHP